MLYVPVIDCNNMKYYVTCAVLSLVHGIGTGDTTVAKRLDQCRELQLEGARSLPLDGPTCSERGKHVAVMRAGVGARLECPSEVAKAIRPQHGTIRLEVCALVYVGSNP